MSRKKVVFVFVFCNHSIEQDIRLEKPKVKGLQTDTVDLGVKKAPTERKEERCAVGA